jgi:Bacteriophage HK97-gp10, putative tail-component
VPYRHLQGDLVALFDQDGVPPLLREVADVGGALMTQLAEEFTPRVTGELAEGWEQLPVEVAEHGGERAYTSGTENRVWYAHLVNYGVEAHDLKPKRAGALDTPEGPRASAEHPGHEGAYMLENAAANTDALIGEVAQPHLAAWAAAQEARASADR